MAENDKQSGVYGGGGVTTGQISVGNATGTFLAVTPHADTALRLSALLDVAKALISERNLDTLLQKILQEASRVVDADRGSLFLHDRETGELWAKIAQGIGGDREIRITKGVGIAGHVAQTGETIKLRNAYDDPRFNPSVDRATGYQTRSLLAVPMVDMHGQIVGVIQVLNKRRGRFTQDDADVLVALGGQAAAAIENAKLHDEIQKLFEGFVQASVVAIESRDPSTAGHSERVSRLTLGLADAVEAIGLPRHLGLKFGPSERMEIRYAALLHDFGKVGVREDVLVKAQKLYPHQLEMLRHRFEFAKSSLESETLRKCVALLLAGGNAADVAREQAVLAQKTAELDAQFQVVLTCNRPTVLQGGSFESLQALQQSVFLGADGDWQPLVTPAEVAVLSIPKGSLSPDERLEIESHVTHTFRFLSQIPWTRSLKRVPEIAHGHHEKLDGHGYPRGLAGESICIEARMMAIADIYDALTASDRPYKKAVPHDIALRILDDEARDKKVDGDLLALFKDADVPRRVFGLEALQPSGSGRVSGIF
jgi:HD-GYP domain-containing protein (c-di-GMP phosphodiesterase class II)